MWNVGVVVDVRSEWGRECFFPEQGETHYRPHCQKEYASTLVPSISSVLHFMCIWTSSDCSETYIKLVSDTLLYYLKAKLQSIQWIAKGLEKLHTRIDVVYLLISFCYGIPVDFGRSQITSKWSSYNSILILLERGKEVNRKVGGGGGVLLGHGVGYDFRFCYLLFSIMSAPVVLLASRTSTGKKSIPTFSILFRGKHVWAV